MLKSKKGITLIALIITIIVLLILAVVSIMIIMGDNGILSKSKDATINMEKAEVKEDVELTFSAAYTEFLANSNIDLKTIFERDDNKIFHDNIRGRVENIEVTETSATGIVVKESGRKYRFNIDFVTQNVSIVDIDGTTGQVNPTDPEEPVELTNIYATLYTDGTLSFCTTTDKLEEKTVSVEYGNIREESYQGHWVEDVWYPDTPWCNENSQIKVVNFQDEIVPIAAANWFAGCVNLERFENMQNLNTTLANSLECMFYACRKLTEIDVSHFNTSNVTNFISMFDGGSGQVNMNVRKIIGIENFDTSKATAMAWMFSKCEKLENIDVSNFDTSHVTDMRGMFCWCKSIKCLNLVSFDTSRVSQTYRMFYLDGKLESILISDKWNMSNVTNSTQMFDGCTVLKGRLGTTYSSSYTDKTYARVDENSLPGYLVKSALYGENYMPNMVGITLYTDCNEYSSGNTWNNKIDSNNIQLTGNAVKEADGSVTLNGVSNNCYGSVDVSKTDNRTVYIIAKLKNSSAANAWDPMFTSQGTTLSSNYYLDVFAFNNKIAASSVNGDLFSEQNALDYSLVTLVTDIDNNKYKLYINGVFIDESTAKPNYRTEKMYLNACSRNGSTTIGGNPINYKFLAVARVEHSEAEILENVQWLMEKYNIN